MIATLALNLDEKSLQEIKQLEQEIGCPILAFSTLNVEPADLDEQKLARIRALEKSKGIQLVAVRK
jgi:hypothetical protein